MLPPRDGLRKETSLADVVSNALSLTWKLRLTTDFVTIQPERRILAPFECIPVGFYLCNTIKIPKKAGFGIGTRIVIFVFNVACFTEFCLVLRKQ